MHIEANGVTLAYSQAGNGRPLLLVHGYPLSREIFEAQVAGLAGPARVITVDLRGHGDSQAVPGPYSVDLLADDLNALLDALGVNQPVVLGGLSMGGYVVFAFYRKYAHRVAGLILTATRAGADSPEGKAGRDQAIATAQETGVAAIAAAMLPKMLAPATYQQRPELVRQVERILGRTSLDGVLGDLAALRDRPDSTPTLARIDRPTLILPGADDQIIPLSEAEGMRAGIRDAQMIVIPQAGHLTSLENPTAFNQAVSAFLERI